MRGHCATAPAARECLAAGDFCSAFFMRKMRHRQNIPRYNTHTDSSSPTATLCNIRSRHGCHFVYFWGAAVPPIISSVNIRHMALHGKNEVNSSIILSPPIIFINRQR